MVFVLELVCILGLCLAVYIGLHSAVIVIPVTVTNVLLAFSVGGVGEMLRVLGASRI